MPRTAARRNYNRGLAVRAPVPGRVGGRLSWAAGKNSRSRGSGVLGVDHVGARSGHEDQGWTPRGLVLASPCGTPRSYRGRGAGFAGTAVVPAAEDSVTLFLCGDVMTGRGVDQVLPHPGSPVLHEPYIRDAREYVKLAERANG